MINLVRAETPLGEPVMSDSELAVFVSAFETSGFTGSINRYRNHDRNWRLLEDVDPIFQQPTLMIFGELGFFRPFLLNPMTAIQIDHFHIWHELYQVFRLRA